MEDRRCFWSLVFASLACLAAAAVITREQSLSSTGNHDKTKKPVVGIGETPTSENVHSQEDTGVRLPGQSAVRSQDSYSRPSLASVPKSDRSEQNLTVKPDPQEAGVQRTHLDKTRQNLFNLLLKHRDNFAYFLDTPRDNFEALLEYLRTASYSKYSNFASIARAYLFMCDAHKNLMSYQGFVECGDGYCLCKDTRADCSCNLYAFRHIPRLPAEIQQLNLSYNYRLNINRDNFFENVSNITFLDLSNCGLQRLSRDAFCPLRLTRLVLNGNPISYQDFSAFASNTLEVLSLSACDLGPLPGGIFDKYPMPNLRNLTLGRNRLGILNMTLFQPLTHLHDLEVLDGQFWKVVPAYLPHLLRFSASLSDLGGMWETCRNGSSLFPNLQVVILAEASLTQWGRNLCLPKLQILLLPENVFTFFYTEMFSFRQLPELQVLSVSAMKLDVTFIQAHSFESPKLLGLDLSENKINFSSNIVDEDSFQGCPNVRNLFLSKNDFSGVTTDRFLRLFGHLKQLFSLGLSSTNIRNISAQMFSNFELLQYLELYDNRLALIPDGAFSSMVAEAVIHLQNNQISTVQEAAFSPATRQRLQHLDLSDNPFRCSCDLRWFRHWLTTDLALFRGSHGSYTCDNLANKLVVDFTVVDQACLLSHQTSLLIIVITSAIIISLLLLLTVFRYRWHLRLLLYEAFRGQGQREQRLRQQHFDYDIFVSYEKADGPWVREYLMPELEDRLGLRLCLHERDFIPGTTVVDNICDCVEASKKVLMLFSISFSHSPWCQFELNYSLTHAIENDDMLLVVLLHRIPGRDLTPAMRAVMKIATYIEWPDVDEPDARHSFWRRIEIALAEITTAL